MDFGLLALSQRVRPIPSALAPNTHRNSELASARDSSRPDPLLYRLINPYAGG